MLHVLKILSRIPLVVVLFVAVSRLVGLKVGLGVGITSPTIPPKW